MKNYRAVVYEDTALNGEKEWIAEFPDVRGVSGGGDTPEEAIQIAYENLNIYLESLEEDGVLAPISTNPFNSEYSGKISLRIPKQLHKAIALLSEDESVSINSLINNAISYYLGKKEYEYKFKESLDELKENIETNVKLNVMNGMQNIIRSQSRKEFNYCGEC